MTFRFETSPPRLGFSSVILSCNSAREQMQNDVASTKGVPIVTSKNSPPQERWTNDYARLLRASLLLRYTDATSYELGLLQVWTVRLDLRTNRADHGVIRSHSLADQANSSVNKKFWQNSTDQHLICHKTQNRMRKKWWHPPPSQVSSPRPARCRWCVTWIKMT